MNPEIKQRWLEALRSGEYKQGREYLNYSVRDERFYCCLGVLCELAVADGVVEQADDTVPYHEPKEIKEAVAYGEGLETQLLPQVVMDWAGIEENSGKFEYSRREIEFLKGNDDDYENYYGSGNFYLTELNDEGLSFEKIADLIESEF